LFSAGALLAATSSYAEVRLAVEALPSRTGSFGAVVGNRGPQAEQGLTLEIPMPKGFAADTWKLPPGGSGCDGGCREGDVLRYELEDLAPGESFAARVPGYFELQYQSPGQAPVRLLRGNELLAEDSARIPGRSPLGLASALDRDPVPPGGELAITLGYSYEDLYERLPVTASLILHLPDGVALVSSSPGATLNGRDLRWDLGALRYGFGGGRQAVLSILPDTPPGSVLPFGAEVVADSPWPPMPEVRFASRVALDDSPVLAFGTAYPVAGNPGESLLLGLRDPESGWSGSLSPGASAVLSTLFLDSSWSNRPWRYLSSADEGFGARLYPVDVSLFEEGRESARAEVIGLAISAPAAPIVAVELPSEPVPPGQQVSQTVHFVNAGTSPLESGALEVRLPGRITLVDADGGTLDGETVRWDLGRIAPRAGGERTMRIEVAPEVLAGSILATFASFRGEWEGLHEANARSAIRVGAPEGPLLVEVALPKVAVPPGAEVEVAVRVGNRGPQRIERITVRGESEGEGLEFAEVYEAPFDLDPGETADQTRAVSVRAGAGQLLAFEIGAISQTMGDRASARGWLRSANPDPRAPEDGPAFSRCGAERRAAIGRFCRSYLRCETSGRRLDCGTKRLEKAYQDAEVRARRRGEACANAGFGEAVAEVVGGLRVLAEHLPSGAGPSNERSERRKLARLAGHLCQQSLRAWPDSSEASRARFLARAGRVADRDPDLSSWPAGAIADEVSSIVEEAVLSSQGR
jgi:hypothetical protein